MTPLVSCVLPTYNRPEFFRQALHHDQLAVLLRRPQLAEGDNARLYMRGHLLSNKLGGRGDKVKNITNLTYSANPRHQHQVESHIKKLINQ
jgi:hypothetical protein